MSKALLEVKNLSMHYDTMEGNVDAVKNISFEVKSGESFGLVGESGCGKTSVAMTLLQLQPDNSVITQGSIKLDGKELIGLSENDLRKVRWDSISIVFQGAMNAWNPVIKIGEQIREAMREHYPENTKQENVNKIIELFNIPYTPSIQSIYLVAILLIIFQEIVYVLTVHVVAYSLFPRLKSNLLNPPKLLNSFVYLYISNIITMTYIDL